MKTEIFLEIDKDGIITRGKTLLQKALHEFAGKRLRITIEPNKRKRSNQQNRYFHGCVIPLVQEKLIDLGFNEAKSNEWTKDFIKYNCLIKEFVSEHGEVIKSIGKTSELTTSEFMDMIAEVQQWASEKMGLYIPDPAEQLKVFDE